MHHAPTAAPHLPITESEFDSLMMRAVQNCDGPEFCKGLSDDDLLILSEVVAVVNASATGKALAAKVRGWATLEARVAAEIDNR